MVQPEGNLMTTHGWKGGITRVAMHTCSNPQNSMWALTDFLSQVTLFVS